MDRVVLGAGPIGLAAAYVLDADAVVAEIPGGSRLRRYAPTFLWRTEATEALLVDLEVPFESRTVRFGCLDESGVGTEFSEAGRLVYFRRSRGIDPGAPVEVPDSAMASALSGEIETFDVSVDDLVEALLHHVEVTVGQVLAVDVRPTDGRKAPRVRVAVSGEREIWTRSIVNTLPAPVFDSVVRHDDGHHRAASRTWAAGDKTFIRVPLPAVSNEIRRARRELKLAYLYVVSPDRDRFPYDRVNLLDDSAVFEFNRPGAVPRGGTWEALDRFTGRVQVLGQARDAVEYAGAVWHVGRLARWSHSIRIHDVVEDLYEAV